MGETYVQEEFLGEESLGEKYMGENSMGEKSVGSKSLGENRVRWDAGFRFPLSGNVLYCFIVLDGMGWMVWMILYGMVWYGMSMHIEKRIEWVSLSKQYIKYIYIYRYMHACIQTYIHTYINTYIHAYIHIYIYNIYMILHSIGEGTCLLMS